LPSPPNSQLDFGGGEEDGRRRGKEKKCATGMGEDWGRGNRKRKRREEYRKRRKKGVLLLPSFLWILAAALIFLYQNA